MGHHKLTSTGQPRMCVTGGLFLVLLHLAAFNFPRVVAQCSASEREALLTFKSLVLDPRDDLASWGTSGPDATECCRWRGIQCAKSGVAAIDLDLTIPIRGHTVTIDSNRPGAIAMAGDALGKLPQLLVIRTNWVVWNGPFPFAKLRHLSLRQISIRNGNLAARENKFGGALPNDVGAFPNLEVLVIAGSRFTLGLPSALCKLKLLRVLEFTDSHATGSLGPSCLGSLPDLEEMRLGNNFHIRGGLPVWPTNLPKLKVLDLSGNSHSGNIPAQYGRLPHAVQIFLAGNKLAGRLPAGLNQRPVSAFRPGNPSLCGGMLQKCPT